ncbi:MAG TPA: hypothetical protein VHS57_05865 [Acidimicrobiales bacterium]|nr:hypothetical protein [Acidimicrobiales bacterium]
MVRVIRFADDGTEMESVDLDDFTVEVVYSGISDMLRDAAASKDLGVEPSFDLTREARRRRERVLTRVRG